MKTLSCLSLAALALASLAPAVAAVNPAIIPADARWVVYGDLDTLRTTTVGKELVAMVQKAQMRESPIGIDLSKLMTTVGTVTAYGTNLTPDPNALDGTIVIQGSPDLRKIAESILLQGTVAHPECFEESDELPFKSYTVKGSSPKEQKKDAENAVEAEKTQPAVAVIVAFPPEPIVLVSKSRQQLLKAHETFRGRAASVAKTPNAPLRATLQSSANAYLFAATVAPADELFQGQSRILKLANSGSIALGEQGPNTVAHASLRSPSDDAAEKLEKILAGMTAALSLTETTDKQLAEFLNSARVGREDRTVTLNLSYSSERLVRMIHSLEGQARDAGSGEAEARPGELLNGEPLAQWQAQPGEQQDEEHPTIAWRTIENVPLKNGAIISLGRSSSGGHGISFDRVEISPAEGGAPLVFGRALMRGGPRNLRTIAFPGQDGTYTIKVAYVNDPAGKARYAVSLRQPGAANNPN